MEFTVDTKVTGKLFSDPASAVPIFNREFKTGLVEATALLQYETVNRSPIGLGFFRRSIGSEVRGAGLNLQGVVGSPLVYALPIEEGAAPHFPPPEHLEIWVQRHGLSTNLAGKEIGFKRVAFLIARKINITGLQAHWCFRDALEASATRIMGMLEAAQQRVIAALQ